MFVYLVYVWMNSLQDESKRFSIYSESFFKPILSRVLISVTTKQFLIFTILIWLFWMLSLLLQSPQSKEQLHQPLYNLILEIP